MRKLWITGTGPRGASRSKTGTNLLEPILVVPLSSDQKWRHVSKDQWKKQSLTLFFALKCLMKVDENLPSHFQDTYVLYTHPARPRSDPMRYLLAWQRSLLNLGDPAKLPTASRKLPTAYSAYNFNCLQPTKHCLRLPQPTCLLLRCCCI